MGDDMDVGYLVLNGQTQIPPHTGQNGHHNQINEEHVDVLERTWRKGNPGALLVGMQTVAATVENSVEFP